MTLRARQLAWQAAPRLLAAGLLLVPASMAPRWLQLWGATALVAAAGCVGWWLAGRLLRRLPALDRALAAAVLGVAVCWLIGLALGQAGALHGDAFRLVLALLCLGSVRATPHARSRTPQIGADVAGQSGVPVGGWRDRRRLARMEAALLVGVLAIAAGALVGALRQQRFAPPGRFSYDDTSYHLTTVATWAQRHDLSMPRFSYGDPRTAFYPFAAELAAWIATAPFAGGDFAARWVELPFALLTLFAAALVARRLGARGATPLLAPLLYLTVPNAFPDLALSAGNDHAVAFGVLATAHAGLLLARRRSVGRALYAGTALGLLLAIKLVGLLYAPALAVLLVLAAVTAPRPRCARWRRAAGVLAVAAGAALLVGGYAYLRNAVTAGNPLFPVPLRIGKLALPGWKEFALGGVMAAEPGFTPTTFPWTQTLLLGPLWRWTMLPAALLAPWLALALARRRRLVSAWLLALPLTFYGIFVELMEDHRGIRYLFAAVALAAVGAAWLVGRLPLPARAVATAIIGGAAVLPWLQRRPSWVGVLLAVLLAGAWLAQAGRVAWWRGRASAAAGRLAVAV
ncbi:MAG TPA: hypothetical protein VGV61_12995, partial [Thermoanaerobaculia bacterium]|nr:hypothetical protein [Thermoanaerobaculia bacterium]